jgi:hypothetical protein
MGIVLACSKWTARCADAITAACPLRELCKGRPEVRFRAIAAFAANLRKIHTGRYGDWSSGCRLVDPMHERNRARSIGNARTNHRAG